MPSTIHKAQTGEHITFLPGEGDVLRMSFVIDGGGLVAAEHFHPEQEERFEVVTGTLRVRMNGREREVHAGERIVVPAGVPHAGWKSRPRSMQRSASLLSRRSSPRRSSNVVSDGRRRSYEERDAAQSRTAGGARPALSPRSAGRARRGRPAGETARSSAPRVHTGDGPRRPCSRLSGGAARARRCLGRVRLKG